MLKLNSKGLKATFSILLAMNAFSAPALASLIGENSTRLFEIVAKAARGENSPLVSFSWEEKSGPCVGQATEGMELVNEIWSLTQKIPMERASRSAVNAGLLELTMRVGGKTFLYAHEQKCEQDTCTHFNTYCVDNQALVLKMEWDD
jgi:hypothetical protein